MDLFVVLQALNIRGKVLVATSSRTPTMHQRKPNSLDINTSSSTSSRSSMKSSVSISSSSTYQSVEERLEILGKKQQELEDELNSTKISLHQSRDDEEK